MSDPILFDCELQTYEVRLSGENVEIWKQYGSVEATGTWRNGRIEERKYTSAGGKFPHEAFDGAAFALQRHEAMNRPRPR